MSRIKVWSFLIVSSLLFLLSSCGGASNKSSSSDISFQVGDLLNEASEWVDNEIEVEGLCTHICAHGGTKIFLMGDTDSESIRVEANKLGRFTNDCLNQIVNVKGVLKEERIDEAYLQRWEEELKIQPENHGEEGGCDTEKVARGESVDQDTLDRIASFRDRIEEEKEKSGKAYLSFYHIEAISYAIQ